MATRNLVDVTLRDGDTTVNAVVSEDIANLLCSPMETELKKEVINQILTAAKTQRDSPSIVEHDQAVNTQPASEANRSTEKKQTIHVWSTSDEALLVSLRVAANDNFTKAIRHDSLWQEIANEVGEVTANQCMNKWKNIKKKYTEFVDSQYKTGKGREQRPKFYDELDQLYGTRASVKAKTVFDSLEKGGKRAIGLEAENDETRRAGQFDAQNDASSTTPKTDKRKKTFSDKTSPQDKMVRLMEDSQEKQASLHTMLEEQHKARLERMDRFLDIFAKSVEK